MVFSSFPTRRNRWLPRLSIILVHPSRPNSMSVHLECKQYLGLPPYGKISASTSWPYRRRASCQPEDGYIMSHKGWCSRKRYSQYFFIGGSRIGSDESISCLEHDQWLEFDLGHPSTVTSLITKGRGDTGQDQWVTKYKVSFSNDTRLWLYYKDKSHVEPKVCSSLQSTWHTGFLFKEFAANNDRESERIHFLNEPFFARYVRLHPTEWHNHVSMRAAILGCPHQGNHSW
jgi:lactadherin